MAVSHCCCAAESGGSRRRVRSVGWLLGGSGPTTLIPKMGAFPISPQRVLEFRGIVGWPVSGESFPSCCLGSFFVAIFISLTRSFHVVAHHTHKKDID